VKALEKQTHKMCGIQLRIWKDKSCELCQSIFGHNRKTDDSGGSKDDIEKSDLEFRDDNLRRRGPDSYGTISSITYPGYCQIQCAASVLQMRAELREQPVSFAPAWTKPKDRNISSVQAENDDEEHDEQTAYLCWNGEIYQQIQSRSLEQPTDNSNNSKEEFMYDIADTTVVANHLQAPFVSNDDEINLDGNNEDQCRMNLPSSHDSAPQHHIANVMSRLYNAEFAFCVLTQHGVYFGRDLWGRRSLLLWSCPRNCGSFQVVSVAENSPPIVTAATMTTTTDSPTENITTAIEWTEVPPGMVHCILFSEPKEKIPEVAYPKVSFPISRLPKDFLIPPIPQQIGTSQSSTEIISERLWRASLKLEFCLRRAVTIRLDQSSHRRSTGVLFSGGVDSVVLAALAAEILSSQYRAEKLAAKAQSSAVQSSASPRHLQCSPVPILYLYNVSFGPNPEKSGDRKAALKSYNTLREKYKNSSTSEEVRADKDRIENDDNHRAGVHDNYITDDDCDIKIVFRDIVVEWEDICRTEPHIRTLLSPKSTVMDVNIATALWFASRGRAVGKEASNNTVYDNDSLIDNDRSPRVLLLGMGADELMGGYGRHRKAYEIGGWEELKSELTMDQNRLWERNCGRDDRLCSDHGREARFPFLDAHVVRLLQETMANEDGLICDFSLPPGVGDKRILRLVAERLGLEHASGLVKRAIQFGSRISHLSDKKRFGSRRKAKGSTKI
jgi:asparagine synthetase B (glutamine-hydrolysing)